MLVSAVLDRPLQQLVVLRHSVLGWTQAGRYEMSQGPLPAGELVRMEALVVDHFYTSLLFYKGIQDELPVPPE